MRFEPRVMRLLRTQRQQESLQSVYRLPFGLEAQVLYGSEPSSATTAEAFETSEKPAPRARLWRAVR
jgi:hypothetical protein